jgi:hypothetical protein
VLEAELTGLSGAPDESHPLGRPTPHKAAASKALRKGVRDLGENLYAITTFPCCKFEEATEDRGGSRVV